ncbi:MAG: hypothetical protein WBB28_24965 [Crinalium sp.]
MIINVSDLLGSESQSTEQNLIINKLGLQLSSRDNNSAQSLLAALLVTSSQYFKGYITTETGENIITETGQKLSFDNSGAYLFRIKYWGRSWVNNHQIDTFLLEIEQNSELYDTPLNVNEL